VTAATLNDVLEPAMLGGYAVAGLVVLGWEDAVGFAEAGEETGMPVILQAGPACREHMPVPVLGAMFRHLADRASVPVVCHIDHAYSVDECRAGIDHGFTSVMFDGSRKPVDENADITARIVEFAHRAGVSVEGEVGFVGYAGVEASAATRPEDAALFERVSGVDALAVSVGNVHLQTEKSDGIDFDALACIEAATTVPLVLHGASGISAETRRRLARQTRVCKFNVGTELRMSFGRALRQEMAANAEEFDRLKLLRPVIPAMRDVAAQIIRELSPRHLSASSR
jgi:fructose-bisphosphate aldolase class II